MQLPCDVRTWTRASGTQSASRSNMKQQDVAGLCATKKLCTNALAYGNQVSASSPVVLDPCPLQEADAGERRGLLLRVERDVHGRDAQVICEASRAQS